MGFLPASTTADRVATGAAEKADDVHSHLAINAGCELLCNEQVQQGKDEVMLEFLPDTAAAEKEDALCEMTFYVPRDNERYAGDEETPASKVHSIGHTFCQSRTAGGHVRNTPQ